MANILQGHGEGKRNGNFWKGMDISEKERKFQEKKFQGEKKGKGKVLAMCTKS